MRRRPVSRRRFLASAGTGAVALAVSGSTAAPAGAAVPAQTGSSISADEVQQLAEYANLTLPPGDIQALVTGLGSPLATLRALRPAGFADLLPADVYTVPPGIPS
ncbi:MAG TPA: hypothetical protein VII06_16295 [Chloroflexota bacterium]|jgi:hypothetical protein